MITPFRTLKIRRLFDMCGTEKESGKRVVALRTKEGHWNQFFWVFQNGVVLMDGDYLQICFYYLRFDT